MARKKTATYLSLRDRLILNFLFFGVVIILIVGAFSYYTARDILLERTFEQLTSVRVVKKRQIEGFFADRSRDIRLILSSQEARELTDQLEGKSDPEKITAIYGIHLSRYLAAEDYYRSFYVVSAEGKTLKIPTMETPGSKDVQIAPAGTFIPESFVREIEEKKGISILDLNEDKDDPGLFIGGALVENGKLEGMIVLGIAVEAINSIMYENNPYEGLGESGESYLVGDDLLMRSISRFQDNSVLNTRVETIGVRQAFAGSDSTAIIDDYRGIEVLSSFSQVDIDGLNWAILAEIDLDEALVPLDAIRNNILIISSFIILFLFILAVFIANRISKPLIDLKNAAEKIGQGDFSMKLVNRPNNEIGDLTHSFNTMSEKLNRKTGELKLERTKRLRSVINGQELERQRLSRELHDGLGQMLIALKLKLENVQTTENCDTQKMVQEVKTTFNTTIDEVRRISNDLMPAVLYEFGLPTALRNLLEAVKEGNTLKVKLDVKGKYDDLDKTTKTYLYRIAQEAVSNAVKHSGASVIEMKLRREDGEISMQIEDNGCGFDTESVVVVRGNGLLNMRERATLLKGRLEIGPGASGGTCLSLFIPFKNNEL